MLKATALKPVKNVSQTVYPAALENMALRMLRIYEDIEDVMAAFYKGYSCNETKFAIPLTGKNKREKQIILQWIDDMKGAIGAYYYDPVSEILRGTLEELITHFIENEPRGEFVLTVEGGSMKSESKKKEFNLN